MRHDNELITLIWFSVITVSLMIVFAIWWSRVSSLARTYRLVAAAWQGNYSGWSPLLPGRLSLKHAGSVLSMSTYFHRGRRVTELEIDWPDRDMWFEVSQRTFRDIVHGFFNARLKTGNKSFDSSYTLVGQPRERVLTLLTGGPQSAIETLHSQHRPRRMTTGIVNGKLRLVVTGMYREYRAIDSLLRGFCSLYDQLTLIESLEIEFFAHEFGSDEAPICQVCGDEIDESPVACRSCDTLHHLECWRYIGACSIYACGERRYRRKDLPAADGRHGERDVRSTI